MKILFLDDDKRRHNAFISQLKHGDDLTQVYNYKDACHALDNIVFDLVYLDHDLMDFEEQLIGANGLWGQPAPLTIERTGYDVALFIAGLPVDKRPKHIVIHSFNRCACTKRNRGFRFVRDDAQLALRI